MPDGTQLLPNRDEKVIFHFEEIIGDRSSTIHVQGEIVPKTAKTTSDVKTIQLGRANADTVDTYISPRSREVAQLVKGLRQTHGTKMGELSTLISDEKYAEAKKIMEDILRTSKNKTASGLLSYMQGLASGQEGAFFDDVLRLTSGSDVSRKLGVELAQGKDVTQKVDKLYKDGLAQAFGQIYGVEGAKIQSQFDKMKGSIGKNTIVTLGDQFKEGFTGLVSYSQIDGQGKTSFRRADKVDNRRAQMVGTPAEVTDAALLNGVKTQLKARMTERDIAAYKQALPAGVGNITDAEIRDLVVDGTVPKALGDLGYTLKTPPKISSYLSFETNAECFNMGFVLEPVQLERTSVTTIPETGGSTMSQ